MLDEKFGIKRKDFFVFILELVCKTLFAVPIVFFLFKSILLNLTLITDPDSHGYLIPYFLGTREPIYGIVYTQGLILRVLPLSNLGILIFSRFFCTFIFFIFLILLARLISKKETYFVLSLLCLWVIGLKDEMVWGMFVSHSIWYNGLNALFFVILCHFLVKEDIKKNDRWVFIVLFLIALFVRISVFVPIIFLTLVMYFLEPKKNKYLNFFLIQIFIFPLFYSLKKKAGEASFKRIGMDPLVFHRSNQYDETNLFGGLWEFFFVRSENFFSQIGFPFFAFLIVNIFVFFIPKLKWLRIYALAFWLLFFVYFSLSILGKYVFLSFRYNFEMVVLVLILSSSLFLCISEKFFVRGMLYVTLMVSIFFVRGLDPSKELNRYKKVNESFLVLSDLAFEASRIPFLVDRDSISFFSTFYSITKMKNVGYHHKKNYKKKSALDYNKKFFSHNNFDFSSNRCRFGKETNGPRKLCSQSNYLDFNRIKKDYSLEREACYQSICLALFKKKGV